MKKTLLSALAGLAVIGSAVALPSPEEVKKMCEQDPTRYVWVEKTQACVPINPCARNEKEDIQRPYCFPVTGANDNGFVIMADMSFENEGDRDMVIDKYVQEMLETRVTEKIDVGSTGDVSLVGTNRYEYKVIGVKTKDGGYFAMLYFIRPGENRMPTYGLERAANAYGRFVFNSDGDGNDIRFSVSAMDEKLCKDMINFASMLSGDGKISFKGYDSDNYRCIGFREKN